jgi:DNA-binding NarL/FixJ family response regulator
VPALRLAVISPYPAVRAGLRALLAGEGLTVTAEAAEPGDLLGPLGDVDVAVVDVGLGDLDPLLDVLVDLPMVRPVVLGPVASPERIAQAFEMRAWAYLPREAAGEALAMAARSVALGLVAIDQSLVGAVRASGASRRLDRDDPGEDLTAREREVLTLVAEGLANKQIAQRLRISEHTVKFHVAAILAKLGAASRTEAGYLAARRGLIAL